MTIRENMKLSGILLLLLAAPAEAQFLKFPVPVGFLDYGIAGWAVDPVNPASQLTVDIYIDGDQGIGWHTTVLANRPRPDVNQVTGYAGDHGFALDIPAAFRDNSLHSVYAYASGTFGRSALGNSPRYFQVGGNAGEVQVRTETASPVVWHRVDLNQGDTVEVQVASNLQLFPSADPVLHVLGAPSAGGGMRQVAWSDDYGSGRDPYVSFSAPFAGEFRFLLLAYATATAGAADVTILKNRNCLTCAQTITLTQAPFGGVRELSKWRPQASFRVAGRNGRPNGAMDLGSNNDYLIFLMRDYRTYIQHDDDSGPGLYPYVSASTSEQAYQAQAVIASYPGTVSYRQSVAFVQDLAPCTCGRDSDADGLSDTLESAAGTNPYNVDTDGDWIPDDYELLGSSGPTGFSHSEFGSPATPDMYVEMDYMPNADLRPSSTLAADAYADFQQRSPTHIRLHLLADTALAFDDRPICLDTSTACVAGTIPFSQYRTKYFSGTPYFRYMLFALRSQFISLGRGQKPGKNTLITYMGDSMFPTPVARQNIPIHELGHNLGLEHNGNDSLDQYSNSRVHQSVMNYLYGNDFASLPHHSYSYGPASHCESCYTSPKQACNALRVAGSCMSAAGSTCDCDVDEWGSVLPWDQFESTTWNGQAMGGAPGPSKFAWPDQGDMRAPVANKLHPDVLRVVETSDLDGDRNLRTGRALPSSLED